VGFVQLPQVERFSAVTTVGVPDRGEVFLGGVSRSAEWRRWPGPFAPGRAVGREQSHSGLSVRARIHDLRALDAALLAGPVASSDEQADTKLRGMARWAWQQFHQRAHLPDRSHTRRARSEGASEWRARGDTVSTEAPATGFDRAARFFELGSVAEARGDLRLARLYYRMAQKHGSTAAGRRLEKLRARQATGGTRRSRSRADSVTR